MLGALSLTRFCFWHP